MLRAALLCALSLVISNAYAEEFPGKSMDQIKSLAQWGVDDPAAPKVCTWAWTYKQYGMCTPPNEVIGANDTPSLASSGCTPARITPVADASCPTDRCTKPGTSLSR